MEILRFCVRVASFPERVCCIRLPEGAESGRTGMELLRCKGELVIREMG